MKNTSTFLLASLIFCLFSCKNGSTVDNSLTVDSTDTRTSSLSTPINQSFTGTYTDGDWESVKTLAEGGEIEGSGGYLAIEQKEANTLKFELSLFNGAPNYHTGTAEGMLSLQDNVATFVTTEYDGECKITFTFKGNEVHVEQVTGGDFQCGFGQGVMAFGVFKKQKEEAIFKYEGGN